MLPAHGTLGEAQTLLYVQPRFDAVLCNDNIVALWLLRKAQTMDIKVPQELGIITFDREPLSEFADLPLSCVDIDTAAMGEQAAQLLFQHIEKRGASSQILLGVSLIARQSTDRMCALESFCSETRCFLPL